MQILRKVVVPVALLALVVVGALTFVLGGSDQKTLTAQFPRAVSIYQGSDVRVLGVPVGKVDSVTPSGTQVVVTMHYNAHVQIPADPKAVLVSPAIAGAGCGQLPRAYPGGRVLADGARLAERRTAVPVELAQIYTSL